MHVAPGQRPDITFEAFDGWPQATLGPVFPGGSGTVWYGREAVDEGYDQVRIAAHELGHNLGLPDMKPGPCSSLMSGSTGGVDCTNATAERRGDRAGRAELRRRREPGAGAAAAGGRHRLARRLSRLLEQLAERGDRLLQLLVGQVRGGAEPEIVTPAVREHATLGEPRLELAGPR